MLKNILNEHTLTDPDFTHNVTVQWGRGPDTIEYWDELAIYAIEQFGLPGDRYITDISADAMTWSFKSSQDALIFRLRFGEVVT